MQSTTGMNDAAAADTPETTSQIDETTRSAENAFGIALFFSGVRCILKYVFLPFILPLIGIAGAFSSIISLVINTMAIAAIIYSVRTFWKVDYKYKWHYIPVAAFGLLLLTAFMLLDIVELMG
ncbi:MAG: hypothetical protein ACOCYT_01385 [Chloroflexota bacterium]